MQLFLTSKKGSNVFYYYIIDWIYWVFLRVIGSTLRTTTRYLDSLTLSVHCTSEDKRKGVKSARGRAIRKPNIDRLNDTIREQLELRPPDHCFKTQL